MTRRAVGCRDPRAARTPTRRLPRDEARAARLGELRGTAELTSETLVRPARPGDIRALAELAKRTWSDAFGEGLSTEDEAAELEERRSEAFFTRTWDERTTLVAEASGELVGYVQFGDVDIAGVEARPGDRELHRVYVATELQGRGIGRRLVAAALAHPQLANASRVYLQVWEVNERALRLYESFGFATIGRTTFALGTDHVAEDLVMMLERAESRSGAKA